MNQSREKIMAGKRTSRRALLALLVVAAGLAACTTAGSEGATAVPEYEISSTKAGDDVTITTENGTAFANVRSESGIGQAAVALLAGQWPQEMTLRFYLAGLEGLQLNYGDTKIALSVTRSGEIVQGATSGDGGEIATDAESPYWMSVTFVNAAGESVPDATRDGAILVTMPTDFRVTDPTSFELEWIDFYR